MASKKEHRYAVYGRWRGEPNDPERYLYHRSATTARVALECARYTDSSQTITRVKRVGDHPDVVTSWTVERKYDGLGTYSGEVKAVKAGEALDIAIAADQAGRLQRDWLGGEADPKYPTFTVRPTALVELADRARRAGGDAYDAVIHNWQRPQLTLQRD